MSSFYAELVVAGHTYPLRQCEFGFAQATDPRGRVQAKVRHGLLHLTLDVPDTDLLLDWAHTAHKPLSGHVTFFEPDRRTARETVSFTAGQCVSYQESFVAGDGNAGAYVCQLTITSDGLALAPGGAPQAFVAPAAREHRAPGSGASGLHNMAIGGAMGTAARVAAPFVAGADGVPRLPLITGDPPFTVKGPKKGKNGQPDKPGLDPVEFARQLTGQQDGLNKLTVAEFIANRDQYIALSKENKRLYKKGGGRDPKGDAAQKVEREKTLRDKIDALLTDDENLTRKEARKQADDWLSTQAALHDPDQVAGGHSSFITGMGDARVNSAIGASWPSRIRGIDRQVRAHAASMTPEEQSTTYLNIVLPLA